MAEDLEAYGLLTPNHDIRQTVFGVNKHQVTKCDSIP